MVLYCSVVIKKDTTTLTLHVGNCIGFSNFKTLLIKLIRGEQEADEYEEFTEAAVDYFRTKNPLLLLKVDQYQARKRIRHVFCEEITEPDLDIFIGVHDINGKLSKEECTKLLALFQRHEEKFMKNEEVKDTGYAEMYQKFLQLFRKVVRARSSDARLIFN